MDLKTINRIVSQEVKAHSIKEGTVLKRNVIRILGINVTVKSLNIPGEPIGRYTGFIDYPNMACGLQKLIDQGHTITATIKLIHGRWDVISLKVEENEPEETEDWSDPSEEY